MPTINRQRPPTPPRATTPTSRASPGTAAGPAAGAAGNDAWGDSGLVRLLVYGRSGTGKTTFWGSFPGTTLCLVCSGGNLPGELRSINTPENKERITAVTIDSTAQFMDQVYGCLEGPDPEQIKFYEDVRRYPCRYDNVVLDHVSGYQDLTIKEILGLDEIPVAKFRAAGKGESWSVVSQQQYGQSTVMCKDAFRKLLSLRANIIIVAQERTFSEEGDGEVVRPFIGPAVSPSVAGWLAPACDYVVQTFIAPRKVPLLAGGKPLVDPQTGRPKTTRAKNQFDYCLRTGPHDQYMTKFRLPKGTPLPEYLTDPDYGKMMALIRGERPQNP
jgi:hypothetical protein